MKGQDLVDDLIPDELPKKLSCVATESQLKKLSSSHYAILKTYFIIQHSGFDLLVKVLIKQNRRKSLSPPPNRRQLECHES